MTSTMPEQESPHRHQPIRLHPEIADFFAAMSGLEPPMEQRPAQEVREIMNGFALKDMRPRPEDVLVEDHTGEFDGRKIRLRLYRPKGADGRLPVMLYFHGGGWVIGNIDTHDRYVCMLTRSSGVAYLAVDYRLAPEHPQPACIDDAYDALRWIHAKGASLGIDPMRIGISGDSAGGQLTAACTLMSRERGGPAVSFQLLIYPLTDCDFTRPSYHTWDGLMLTTPYMKWFWHLWYGPTLPENDVLATPLRADLHDLPPAYVVTAEYDILRDEGELYARKLMDSRVQTTLRRVIGGTHPLFRAMDVSGFVRDEMREMGHQIRRHLVTEPG